MPRIQNDPELDAKLQEAPEGKENELEIWLISHTLLSHGNVDAERLVLQYGRPFTGIARSKSYRQWARKQCFRNAQSLCRRGAGTYCEGFALSHKIGIPFVHGWITLDGAEAIDVTLPDDREYEYFSIPFSTPTLKQLMIEIAVETTFWSSLVSPPIDPE